MPTLDPKMYRQPAECVLKIINGTGIGHVYPVFIGSPLIIGKGASCDVLLEVLTDNISHKHARLTARGDSYFLENLSQSHSVVVNNRAVDEKLLIEGERFQIDDITFLLEPPEFEFPKEQKKKKAGLKAGLAGFSGKKITLRRVLSLVLSLFLLLLVVIFLGKGEKEENITSEDSLPAQQQPQKKQAPQQKETRKESEAKATPKEVRPKEADRKKADEYFRKGMFFYENNDPKNAILFWRKAVALVPRHDRALTWLEKAEAELDSTIEEHYQSGLKALKYMRTDDAVKEFEIILDMALDGKDFRVTGARQQLQDLRQKQK